MFRKRLTLMTLVALVWATSFSVSFAEKNQMVNEKNIRNSLTLVENLLTKSSLAKKVKTANLPQATESFEQAHSIYNQALKDLSLGKLTEASKARDEIMRLIMLSGRLASKASGYSSKKPAADYEKKLKSVRALLSAHKRITTSNLDNNKESNLQSSIQPLITNAEASVSKKEFKVAMASLNKAYILIAESIKSQRDGQSLVRSLDFKTFEEAYNYEISKFEHYQMLVDMLINDRQTIKVDANSKPFFDKAKNYYDQGLDLASEGQHEQAIGYIEKASKTLVKLIQKSGVYIPGA